MQIASKTLPASGGAVIATANSHVTSGGIDSTEVCELRNGNSFIGGATDRRVKEVGEDIARTLSMNGGAQVPAGGGTVSLWCKSTAGMGEIVDYAQMMMIRLDGFS